MYESNKDRDSKSKPYHSINHIYVEFKTVLEFLYRFITSRRWDQLKENQTIYPDCISVCVRLK